MNDETGLAGKRTILVAGATGNVGGGASLALAKRGARVVLLGRHREKLNARRTQIQNALSGGVEDGRMPEIETLAIDLADLDSVRRATEEALERFPQIHGLVLSSVVYVQNGPTLLPNGHEVMFASNVLGPFLFTQLLIERLSRSHGTVLHVVAPFFKEIDWGDLESIQRHGTELAYNRSKTMGRMIAGELARRYGDRITSIAFDPTFIIDRTDPELHKRWPAGFVGLFWKALTALIAKPPVVAGEPIADLMFSSVSDPEPLNGALFRLTKRVKRDKAMQDEASRERLWETLLRLTSNARMAAVAP
jgi:NAD(P)-dependent dehydrogenase (short-subunit alcohol dehydrogenase family)